MLFRSCQHLPCKVGRANAEELSEQDPREVTDELIGARRDDHAEREHADEQQSDRGVPGQTQLSLDEPDAAHHRPSSDRSSDDAGKAKQHGDGYPWEESMGKCVSDESQSAQDDERSRDRTRQRDEASRDEGEQHELIRRKRFDQEIQDRPPTIWSTSLVMNSSYVDTPLM